MAHCTGRPTRFTRPWHGGKSCARCVMINFKHRVAIAAGSFVPDMRFMTTALVQYLSRIRDLAMTSPADKPPLGNTAAIPEEALDFRHISDTHMEGV